MDIRLIAIDLDGTALTPDSVTISPRLLRDLERADALGVAVAPVTGRQFLKLPPCVQRASWARYAVLCNGAEVRQLPGGAILEAHHMTAETLLRAIPVFTSLGLDVELSSGGVLHTTAEMRSRIIAAPVSQFHRDFLLGTGVVHDDLTAFILSPGRPIDKLNLPYVPPEAHAPLEAFLPSLPLACAWSGPNSMEVTHAEATKGNGLLALCRILGIDPAYTMAIGDSGNDVTMLRAAALGVAMGSAPDFVKDAADAVTAPNTEDGAALAVERYILAEKA